MTLVIISCVGGEIWNRPPGKMISSSLSLNHEVVGVGLPLKFVKAIRVTLSPRCVYTVVIT